jgi:hypothetical protein
VGDAYQSVVALADDVMEFAQTTGLGIGQIRQTLASATRRPMDGR